MTAFYLGREFAPDLVQRAGAKAVDYFLEEQGAGDNLVTVQGIVFDLPVGAGFLGVLNFRMMFCMVNFKGGANRTFEFTHAFDSSAPMVCAVMSQADDSSTQDYRYSALTHGDVLLKHDGTGFKDFGFFVMGVSPVAFEG